MFFFSSQDTISENLSSYENNGFIVGKEDSTFIQFEVSGSNSVHSFKGIDGPQFYYTATDGVSHKAIYLFMING